MMRDEAAATVRTLPVEAEASVEEMARDVGAIACGFRERTAEDRPRFFEAERERVRLDELVFREQGEIARDEPARSGERLKPRAHVRVGDVLVARRAMKAPPPIPTYG